MPGVDKTLSARQYARWQLVQPYFPERFYDDHRPLCLRPFIAETVAAKATSFPIEAGDCHCALYTPAVTNSPQRVEQDIGTLRLMLNYLVDTIQQGPCQWSVEELLLRDRPPDLTDLIIIDEADRLNTASLEQVLDIYDRDNNIGLVLIGMPGLEKRLARYPQLYSRVGFVHQFHALSAEEYTKFLEQQWQRWGLVLRPDNPAEAEAIAAIVRITSGNFRLLNRLLAQIERIVDINALKGISKEVVEVARQQLVIGLG